MIPSIRVGARLTIEADPKIIDSLIPLLTYPNPKYAEAERLGFSTWNIPREIPTYERENATTIHVLRGEFKRCYAHVLKHGEANAGQVSFEQPVLPASISYENNDFELDERQRRVLQTIRSGDTKQGIIHAATSAGKSAIIMALIAQLGTPALVVVHSRLLLKQLRSDAERWLVRGEHNGGADGVPLLGQIGDGEMVVGLVTFAIDKSLDKRLREDPLLALRFGAVIVDECHKAPSSTFLSVLSRLPCRYRFGFTGTLKRKDGLGFLIEAAFGRVIERITVDELKDAGRISPVRVEVIETEIDPPDELLDAEGEVPKNLWGALDKYIHDHPNRFLKAFTIARDILKANPSARVVLTSRYVEPAKRMAKLFQTQGIECGTITGQDKNGDEVCAKLRTGELRIACATLGCFSTGVNIPELTDIVLISPCFSNELLLHQLRGRLMRKAEGKTHGTLHFLFDELIFPSYKIIQFKRIMNKG